MSCQDLTLKAFRNAFVLVYEINEKDQLVTLLDFDHHDNIYKM